ncbi:MAG TPA: phosphate signaling complex protein PhoU [Thermoanaerobaculia bacterium]|jgi:phosphate transport system protein|nr:phosphate signaling complex protein PhoU [Thermoanaerobaculia bacterium]
MHRHFDRDIEEIKDLLLRMGAMVEDSINQSVRSLLERDTVVAEEVIAHDDDIDQMEVLIDQKTIELIAKMQPTASDLRFVATIMKITPELERIADLAQDVCERVIELNREPQLKPVVQLPQLAESAQRMVREALDSFVRGDADLARRVIADDDTADQLTEDSFRALLTYMLENPRNISPAIRLTFIGKYFERMADGATNICEMVVYLVEGKMIKHTHAPGGR